MKFGVKRVTVGDFSKDTSEYPDKEKQLGFFIAYHIFHSDEECREKWTTTTIRVPCVR